MRKSFDCMSQVANVAFLGIEAKKPNGVGFSKIAWGI